jgi:type II secretory pathway component PulJ
MMRKGYLLAEVLILLIVFAAILVVFAPVFSALFNHIPRSYKVAQENTQLLNMLGRMRRDIEAAWQLPESFGEYRRDDKSLLIESAEGLIHYQWDDGKVLRYRLTGAQQDRSKNPMAWSVPNAVIEWAVWKKDNKGYAVEVRTYINYHVGRHLEKKMDNSHVYFVGIFREVLRRK